MGNLITYCVFTRSYSFRLSFISIDAAHLADQHFKTYEKMEEMIRWMDCFEEQIFFYRKIHLLPEKWEKL